MGIVWLVVLKICVLIFANARAVYFTVSDLELSLPGDLTKFPPGNWPLATFHATSERRDLNRTHIRYSLPFVDENLQIFPSTGDVMFRNITALRDVYNINVSAADGFGERISTTMRVIISPTRSPLDCYLIMPDLCYWQSARYKILENTSPTTLGTLSSPYLLEMCKGFKLNYTLISYTKNDKRLVLSPPQGSNNQWTLNTTQKLERDVKKFAMGGFKPNFGMTGNLIEVGVRCVVEDPKGTVYDQLLKNITVEVLDENDNLPEPQEKDDIKIHLEGRVKKGEEVHLVHKGTNSRLLFRDLDSSSVNNYSIEIIGDTLKLFEPSCAIFEDDTHGEPQTALDCHFVFLRDMDVSRAKRSFYRMYLQINDTTYQSTTKSKNSSIKIPIDLRLKRFGTENSSEVPEDPAPLLKPLLLYPDRRVSIFRSAGPYARITQPKDILKENSNFTLINGKGHNGAFNVTKSEGIVYLHDMESLRQSSSNVRITIQWFRSGVMQSDDLEVHLVEDSLCMNMSSHVSTWNHCAGYSSPSKCKSACAIGTGGSLGVQFRKQGITRRCMWRGDKNPGSHTTTLYSTCTPDNKTCPDGVCDSLESLNPFICPQDCAGNMVVGADRNPKTGRGISAGIGVCTCDETTCICFVPKKKPPNSEDVTTSLGTDFLNFTSPPPNLSPHTGPEIATCGKGCLLGVMAGGLFLLGAIAASVACWRFYRVHIVRGKFAADNNGLSAPLSEYVGGGPAPENTLNLNFDMTTSLSQQNQHKMAPDHKWEFPRNQLIIEQTLGEGEFGRVLRARAKDISGQQGYTIVAVKTLKEDARESELSDLLSEYQLLKEVSHPNIIKLLGASTMPGGPVYLIIEFAQHGSLRSYLRRSRHLKSESQIPFSASFEETSGSTTPGDSNYDKPRNCKVSPVDILSFAWQISNGMSYLTDVKLVHRDLAARNVLLTSEKICKISDFGLTRDIYEEDAYFKRSKGRVPVKWMAPESLSDHVYTSKTDVWSFGILVWELVTLGATPYPGIQVQNLFHLIKTGYRMERPDNCSPALYKIMRSCWHIDQDQRPTFHELTERWEKMLGDQVEYLDLTPNAIHNRSYFCTLDENEEDENDNNENFDNEEEDVMIPEENLATNRDYPKCGDTDKLLEEPKPTNKPDTLQLSPLAQGYVTPVKTQSRRAQTPSNEAPEYYTNMEAAVKK